MTPRSKNAAAAPFDSASTRTPRLRLRPDSAASGYIDVAWWPRSSDLATELRALIPALRALTGPVQRIVYDPRAWSPTARHLVTDGTIRLEPYPFELFGTMYLCGTNGTVIVLQAIPSGTDNALASSMLAASGEPAGSNLMPGWRS
ncbi:DUF5994 family protein [Nocardia testacea]|uniref:DUF5994 family protein n=1 Tax=Nocardia testacea TaxID=248551 RepID=UPI003A850888